MPVPRQGDEAVSYKLEGSIEGTNVPMTFTIVRSGSTLAAFYAMNTLDADKAQVPAGVIEAQLTKPEKVPGWASVFRCRAAKSPAGTCPAGLF